MEVNSPKESEISSFKKSFSSNKIQCLSDKFYGNNPHSNSNPPNFHLASELKYVGSDSDSEKEIALDHKKTLHSNNLKHKNNSSRRRKSPVKVRKIEDGGLFNSDFYEIKENESESLDVDSDLLEFEASAKSNSSSSQSLNDDSSLAKSFVFAKNNPHNVVTIDDVRTLHKLASNAKKHESLKYSKSPLIDTNTILSGKATSGVTITPAKTKLSSNNPLSNYASSGVTISSSPKVPGIPLHKSAIVNNQSIDLSQKHNYVEPNLADDAIVIEATSFIVPFVYEKPPKENIKKFFSTIINIQKESNKNLQNCEIDKNHIISNDIEVNKDHGKKDLNQKSFFESGLGKFLSDLGMNLVQESVQTDLLKAQIKKSQKDKSASVMHAIMSLKKNIESSKKTNLPFYFKERRCKFCFFKTESDLALQYHLEVPHIRQSVYKCNFCSFETKLPQNVLLHMTDVHYIRSRLEKASCFHQCPQCPYEDNMKGKLTRHKNSCDKRFRMERNLEPSFEWEPPAKISNDNRRKFNPFSSSNSFMQLGNIHKNNQSKNIFSNMPSLQVGPKGRGRPIGSYKGDFGECGYSTNSINKPHKVNISLNSEKKVINKEALINNVLKNSQGRKKLSFGNTFLGNLSSNSSVTIQSVSQRNVGLRQNTSPSISITPLSGRNQALGRGTNKKFKTMVKPGNPIAGNSGFRGNKGNFVICEICDGYIKDLDQLRNHMLWIHKVKIHPKMICSRPPLNCQKCQFRFFTDQGLERHLLGSHGLVTASMQELADKGQDQGRCPVCGKAYQWKLLNHVAKDHQKILKPAHLSYRCTVCAANFGQYKLFETHVYQAHSASGKKGDRAKSKSIKLERTFTESELHSQMKKEVEKNLGIDQEIIDIDDEEVNNVEDIKMENNKINSLDSNLAVKSNLLKKCYDYDSCEGVEEIEDDEPEDD